MRWVFAFYQKCHSSQVRKLGFVRPSGLKRGGEETKETKLGSLGLQDPVAWTNFS